MPWFCTIICLLVQLGVCPLKASIIPDQRVAQLDFELGKRCTYSYQLAVHTARGSQSTESQGHEIHALVDVTPVAQEANEAPLHTLHLNVYQPRMRRVRGERVLVKHPVNEELERQLSRPFYFRQYEHGSVLDAFYPKHDDPKVIALKKGIAGAFQVHLKSLGNKKHTNIEEHDDSGVYLSKYTTLHSNHTHTTVKREWTNRDYLLFSDGTPAKAEHKVQSKHTATVYVRHGQIHQVHRQHNGVFESPKGNPRAENNPEFQKNEQDIQVLTSGYNKLHLVGCDDHVKPSHRRSRRETVTEGKHKRAIEGLHHDDLVFKDTHKISWKNVGGDKLTFRPFYELMRCFTDPTVKDREIGDCSREIHKLASHDNKVFMKICNLVLQRSHQNVTSWSVLVSVLAGQGSHRAQGVLARALMSEYPRKLTLEEYESLLENVFRIPKGPLHKDLFDALFQHAKRDQNQGHQSPMAMLVLSALVKRAETAGYNNSLSDIVVQLIHDSYNNKSSMYDPNSVEHEDFLRSHIWAFGNLGHISGLNTLLQHANHDSAGIRSAVVSGMRKLPAKDTDKFLLKALYSDEQNDVKAAVLEVYIERHQDLTNEIVEALEHAFWHAEDNDVLDEAVQTFLENHHNHPKAKHIRKRRHILRRQKRALIPALRPREIQLGPNKRWLKKFGGKYLGAESAIQFRNQVRLRIGIFGGNFEVNLDNYAKIQAYILKWGFDIVKGKAAFKASASFKNDIPKDLIHAIADAGDDILSKVDGITNIIIKHIEKFKQKLKNLVPLNLQKVIDFVNKIVKFVENLIKPLKPINLMKKILDMAKRIIERLKNWEWLMNNIRDIQLTLKKLNVVDDVFNKVIGALSRIMNIINSIKLRLPHGLPPNFKIEDLFKWLKAVSVDLFDIKIKEFFKLLGLNSIPKGFNLQMPFRFSLHFSFSMDKFIEISMKFIKFANNFLDLSSLLDALESIRLPRLSLPRLEAKFPPMQHDKWFDFGLSFDWKVNLNFDLDLKSPSFLKFINVLGKLSDFLKRFKLPSFSLEKFFKEIMPDKSLDLAKFLKELFGKNGNSTAVGGSPADVLQDFFKRILNFFDLSMPNVTAISDITDFFKELGPKMKDFAKKSVKKLCQVYKISLNSSRDFKTFGENIEREGISILMKVDNTTQSALQELVHFTFMIDRLIDDIEKNFTLATRGFVSTSLAELSKSLKEVQTLADKVVKFANGTTAKASGVCNKAADFSANIIDDVQNVSRQALSELTSFIGPVSHKIKGIGQDLKTAVDKIELWYKENMEVRVGKISKIARLVADLMSILNTKKGFLGKVHEIAVKVNDILTHLKNVPAYAQKARKAADDIIKFADHAQTFKDQIQKLDIRKQFRIDYDKKVRELCDKFKIMAAETLNKIGGYDIVGEVNEFFTKEAEKLITKAGSKLRRIKQPIDEIRTDLKEISIMVNQVIDVFINLRPFSNNFSPILATINKLPDCQQAEKILTESILQCVQKSMVVGQYTIDQYKDMRQEVKMLYEMIPETWKSLKIQKCMKGGACISKAFIQQAKTIQEKVEKIKNSYKEASGYTDMLGTCRAGLDNITQVIDSVKLLIKQVKDFNLKDDMKKVKNMLRSITGRNLAQPNVNPPVRSKRGIKDAKENIKRVIDYVQKAKETKQKLEEILKNTFKAMKSVYDSAIFEHIQKIEDVSKKVNRSYELWKKTKDINAILQGLDDIIKESSDYGSKMTAITKGFSSPVVKFLTDTGELSDVIKPYLTKYIDKVKKATDKINGFFKKVTEFQNKIQLRQKGLDLSQYKNWNEYPYCSADVCLRPLRRSSSLYYSTIFTWKFPHLDDLSSMTDTGRWLTPGLFDDYKVEGITQLSNSEMLLGMHGISSNEGKASLLVVTDLGRSTLKKIIQLGSPQSPFTVAIGGVTVARNNIYISDGNSRRIYRISKGSVTGSTGSAAPTWIGISKSYSVEGVGTSVSFDDQKTMLWITDGKAGKGYGYRLTPSGDLVSGKLAPDRVLVIGKDAQGMAIVRQFSTDFVVVSRCAWKAGYQCKLEFHDLSGGDEISENSLSRVVRTPTGLESVDKARNDLIVVAFSSGTYSEKDKIESIGGDFEDRYFRMKLPILKMTFGISENCLMFKVMGEWIISPRRLFPFGDLRCGALRKRSIQNELLESDVYSQELEDVHTRTRRSSGEVPSCMTLFRGNIRRGYQQFMPDWQQVIIVFGIPVRLFAGAGGYWFVDYAGKVCMRDRTFRISLIPGAWISVHAGASVSLWIVEAGITIEAILLETYLIPELTVKIDKWPLKACIELKMRMTPLKIRVWLWYRFRLCIKIRCKCFSCSIRIRWCSKKTFAEWWWSARQIERTLFSTCKEDIDRTPPVAGTCSAKQVGDKAYFVQWHGFKEDTAINHYWVKIGSISGSGDDYGANHGTSLSALVKNLPIMDERDVFASVRATNDGGLDSSLALCPVFQAKRIGPQIRFVYDGSQVGVDKDYQSDNFGMGVNFAWSNTGQKIVDVKWGISTVSTCTFDEKEVDVYGLASVGETTSIQTSGLSLTHGVKYYTRIIATNSVGLRTVMCSDGITVDTTPPSVGLFYDGAGERDADFMPSTKRVRATFEPFMDGESPMAKYEWKVVQYIDSQPFDITPFVNIPLSQRTPLMDNLDLHVGNRYNLILRGTNAAGLSAITQSNGFVADNTGPSCSPVLDVLSINDSSDVDFVRQLSSLQAKWNCVDKESGITKQLIGVGTYPGGDDLKQFVNIQNTTAVQLPGITFVKFDNIKIQPKVRYHITIKAFNGARLRRTVTSDGILIDTTPPTVATQYIKDGFQRKDVNYTKERFTFSAHWEQAFADAESGLTEFSIGLGSVPGKTDVRPLKVIGKQTKATLEGLMLESGERYFVTVVGCNGVQMCVNGSSNGAIVDFERPHPGTVETGYTGPPVLYQWITESVWARWKWCRADQFRPNGLIDPSSCPKNTFYDVHSGITVFGMSVKSLVSGKLLDDFTTVGKVQMSGRSIELKDGIYTVAVRATDRAGMKSYGVSNGFIVDSSPVEIINLQHGHQGTTIRYTKDHEYRFKAYFELEDNLSRVVAYKVNVGSYPGADDVFTSKKVEILPPLLNIPVNWTAERSSKLENSRKYFITVLAFNGAGLVGSASSEALFSDTEPPKYAIVLDGWDMEDVKYQSFSSVYRAHWYGISDFSGVHSIHLGLKSSLDKQHCDVKGYEQVPNKNTFHLLSGLKLISGNEYFACLKVIDNAQNVAYFSSNGVTVDTTPPVPGQVADGFSGVDIDVQADSAILWASWTNFKEVETQIVRYSVAFGTSPGIADIQEFTNVGLVQNAASTRLSVSKLTSGQRYYATVVALNNLGMQSAPASSNGVTVDATPPLFIASVRHGSGIGVVDKYTRSQSLPIYWNCVDNETGVQSVIVAFGLQPGSSDVMNLTSLPVHQTKYTLEKTLQLGVRYFATVICKNKVGLKSVSTSAGVIFDNTPPQGQNVLDGNYQNSATEFTARWKFYDTESGMKRYQVSLYNRNRSLHQGPFDFAGAADLAVVSLKVPLEIGIRYFTNVTGYNGVEMVSSVLSDGFLVDNTPPECDRFWHGSKEIQKFIGITNTLEVSWKCAEDESKVTQIRFAVQEINSKKFILPFHSKKETLKVAGTTSVNGNGKWLPKYVEGKRYRVAIELTNAVNLKSVYWTSGVLVDSTPPIVNHLKLKFNPSGDSVIASWKLKDEQSGIASLKWGLGASSDKTDILHPKEIEKSTAGLILTKAQINFQQGKTYFLFLFPTNNAGLLGKAVSNGIVIDRSPPKPGTVIAQFVLPVNYDRNKNVVPGSSFAVSWTGFADDESGIVGFSWSVGTTLETVQNLNDIYYTKIPVNQSIGGVQIYNYTLSGNTTYYVCIRATNGAGLKTTNCSNAMKVVLGKFSAGIVNDGPRKSKNDIDFQLDDRAIWTFWDGFKDPVFKIREYKWCVADHQPVPSAKEFCKWPFMEVNHLRKYAHRFHNITLSHGTTYYTIVRAFNMRGESVQATSDGVLVDRSAPYGKSINVSPTSGKDTLYLTTSSAPTITWEMEDKESGIRFYTISVGSFQYQDDLINSTRLSSLQRSQDLDDLNFNLSHGLSFFVSIDGYNMLGLKSFLSTQQILVDWTPPVSGVVRDGNSTVDLDGRFNFDADYQTNSNFISSYWTGFKDEESKVVKYQWCIGLRQGRCDILTMASTGLQTSATAYLSLQQGARYYTTVIATNAAGLKVQASSDGVTVDSSPPTIGDITFVQPSKDITLKKMNNITVQSSGRSLKVEWTKASDDQSLIFSLLYCIGKNQGTCDVKGWTTLDSEATSLLENFETPIAPGTALYITLQATNGAGLSVIKKSGGLLLDSSPPTIGSVSVGNVPGIKYIQEDEAIEADWGGFEDRESGLDRYEWVICQAVKEDECLTQFIDVGLSTKLKNDKLELQPGLSYVLKIKAFNRVGLYSSGTSNIFVLDNSKPIPGDVFDGSDPFNDQDVQSSAETLSANWDPFRDFNSRITKYEMCIGSNSSICDVSPLQTIDSENLSGETRGLTLVHKKTYYATIRATNEAGFSATASSNGVTIDKTPPVGGMVRDGSVAEDVDFQSSGSYVSANWDQFTDEESGITKYIWCAGSTQGSCDVVDEREITDGSTKAQIQIEPSIVSGVKVFVKVTAVNGAGGETTLYSDGLKIDSSPPELLKVRDLAMNDSSIDINFLTSKTKYCASWVATDQESGILNSEISVCEEINPTSCLARSVDVGNRSRICMSSLEFIPGVKYITTVQARNNVGLTTRVNSNGFTLDFTPPISGNVRVGNTSSNIADALSEFTSSRIQVQWNDFLDKETVVVNYFVCLGNYSGSCGTRDWEDVGLRMKYTFDNVELLHGVTYYASVMAENQAGLKSIVESSKGIYVDKTAPIAGSPVYDGSKEGSDIDFQISDYDISANWKPFEDLESDLVSSAYCVGTSRGYCDVLSLQSLSPQLHKARAVLNTPLKNGQRLYFTVHATNGAGLTTTVTSDGVTIDNTPPRGGRVFDGNSTKDIDYFNGEDDFVLRWFGFEDDQSSITSYEVAVCNARNLTDCPQKFTNVNNATSIKISGLELQSGTMYFGKVRAINKAGLQTEISSNGFTVDFTPPNEGVAWIGQNLEKHTSYQANATSLRVGWMSFTDAESGIVSYELCVQSSTSSVDCTHYVNAGNVNTYELTRLNLQHGSSYFVNVRATNGIGMTSLTRTKEVLIDTTAPRLINQAPSAHIKFSCTEELVVVNWDEFEDSESHMDRYEWCVGTSSGSCDVTSKKSVKRKLIGRKIVKRISSGSRLFATVAAFNKAGLKSVLKSKQCLVITVAPKLNIVSDLEQRNSTDIADIDWTSNMKTLTLKWETIGKFLNDISRMRVEVAVTHTSGNKTLPSLENKLSWKGESFAQGFMAVHPDQQNVTIESMRIKPWNGYRGIVRVWNEGEIYTEKASDGLRVEPSSPLPRLVDVLDGAIESERDRWLPNLRLPSFNLSDLDPDVMFVSSADDISIAVRDVNNTNSSLSNLNKILDSGAYSPTEDFKLVVNRVTSDSNETNTTQHSIHTKTLPGFADPSGPCCTNHTPHWLVMRSDTHYKPTTFANMFGSNIVQLPNDFVAISSLHSVYIFSRKNRLLDTKIISIDDRNISILSYSQSSLVVTCDSGIISIYRLWFESNGKVAVDLEASISKSIWSDLKASAVAIDKDTLVSNGKSSLANTSVAGIFRRSNGTWHRFKVVQRSKNDPDFGISLALNDRILAVLTGDNSVIIYSASDFSTITTIDLKPHSIDRLSLQLTQDNSLVIVSKRSNEKVVVIQIDTSSKSWKTVCSYDAPDDIRFSGEFDLIDRDGGTVVVIGMQTRGGRDGVILTGFNGDYAYHPFHQKGKCIGLGRIIAREDVPRVDDGVPRASVSAKGSTILFGTPMVMTWPDGSERDGTGRVYSMVHCPRNYRRTKISSIEGQEAFQCEVCESGRKSLGAITRICEICADRKCASPFDVDPIHFVSKICNNTQCPIVKRFDNKTNAIKIEQEHDTFFQEGAVNEYTIELVETTRANMSTSSKSRAFIIDSTSPAVGTVYDGLGSDPKTNCSKNETFGEDSQCSTRKFQDTDIDFTNITREVHARWADFADNGSDISEYFFCVGSRPMQDDILQCKSTGLRQNASEFGFNFKQGDTYFVTVVACNGARRCSAGHSNGVTIDTTPPQMLYVRDGVLGPDIDFQAFVDIIFAYFKAYDPDSGVTSYEVAWGTSPGSVDTKDFEEIGNTTTWFANFKDNALKKKVKYYATVRATNKAGLMSEHLSSNGVIVGKSEYIFDKNASANFFFDTVNMNPNGTRKDGGVGKTYGTLSVPEGAVDEEVKITCYSLDKKTLESKKSDDGPVSDPSLTKPKQFMLGNYSFQIKAFDPKNNTIQEGYKFVKPITISMFYDVNNLVNANKRVVNKELGKEDIDPILYLWDIKNKTWIDAALTCPEPWSHVNRSFKLLTVKICHLTQFSFYWTFKAQRGLMMFDKNSSVYDYNGDINIIRQSSVQEIELPVKRSKGSSGNIEVYWSLYSNQSNHRKIMWPDNGKVSFQEGQWNASISVVITSDRVKTDERTILVRLTNVSGGAILASDDLTTAKFIIPSNLVAVPETSSSEWIIIGVCSGLALILLILLVIFALKRRKKQNKEREKGLKKSLDSSVIYTVRSKSGDSNDGQCDSMEMTDTMISTDGIQGPSFAYDKTPDLSDDEHEEAVSPKKSILGKLRSKSPKIKSGIVNPAAFDTASNTSTSDDEQLQENKPKRKISLKKSLSLGKSTRETPREFENPAYGSLFALQGDLDPPMISVENSDVDDSIDVSDGSSSPVTKLKTSPIRRLDAWGPSPAGSTENLFNSKESLVSQEAEIQALKDFGAAEPENESTSINDVKAVRPPRQDSFNLRLPGSSDEAKK